MATLLDQMEQVEQVANEAPMRVQLEGRLATVTGRTDFEETIIVRLSGPSQYGEQLSLTEMTRRQRRVRITVEEIEA